MFPKLRATQAPLIFKVVETNLPEETQIPQSQVIITRAVQKKAWRVGRVAEGGGLLNRYRVKNSIGGSNPPLSAILLESMIYGCGYTRGYTIAK